MVLLSNKSIMQCAFFKQYKGKVDLITVDRIVGEFLRHHLEAEVREAHSGHANITIGNEYISVGAEDSKIYFEFNNPANNTLELIKLFNSKMNLKFYFGFPGDKNLHAEDVNNLSLANLT